MRAFFSHRGFGVLNSLYACLLVIAFTVFGAVQVHAEMVRDLYKARVPVAGQNPDALAAASREAMAQVLVKVSGSRAVLDYPEVKSALSGARRQVQQYSYQRDPMVESGLVAKFQFDQSYINGLITTAGAPLWTANRPVVLLWLVLEDEEGRRFFTTDSDETLGTQVAGAFSERGVPVKIPLHDLADAAALDIDKAWQLDARSIRAASERYDVDEVLAGRVLLEPTGQVSGDWLYLSADEASNARIAGTESAVFLQRGVALVAEDLAGRYAVAAAGNSFGGVTMRVRGVSSYADYAGIVSWLEKLELIEHANVERIAGDVLDLRLQTQAEASQLVALLELNEALLPLPPEAQYPAQQPPQPGPQYPVQEPGMPSGPAPSGPAALPGTAEGAAALPGAADDTLAPVGAPQVQSTVVPAELHYQWMN